MKDQNQPVAILENEEDANQEQLAQESLPEGRDLDALLLDLVQNEASPKSLKGAQLKFSESDDGVLLLTKAHGSLEEGTRLDPEPVPMENTTMKIPDKDGQFEWTLTYTVINRKKKPGITVELIDLTKEELAQESESDTVVEGDVPNTEIQDIQEDEVAADAVRTDEEPVEELAPEANLAEELAEAQVDVILLNVPPDFTHALAFNEDVYDTGAELADMAKKVAIALAGQASLAVDGISVRSVSLLWSDDHTYTPTLAVLLTTQASAVMTFAYTPSCPTTVMWTQGESSTIMSKSQALYDYVVSFELSEGIVEDGYYETASGSAPISLLDDNEWGLFKNTMFNGLSKWNAR